MDNIKPAGFWRRFAALILDSLILAVPFWILSFFLTPLFFIYASPAVFYLVEFGYYLVAIVYGVAFLASRWQATPGKQIMKVYVARAEDGQRISFARSLGRYLVLNAAVIIFMVISLAQMPPFPHFTPEEQQQFAIIQGKMLHREPITPEEKQLLDSMVQPMMQDMLSKAGISPEEQQRLFAIQEKQRLKQPLTAEEQQFSQEMAGRSMKNVGLGLLAAAYMLLIALMVGLSRYKTGLHDRICKTRALRGTPDAPILAG